MKIKTKKHHCEEKAAMRRCQVLDAAANCFRRKGYHAASMAEIARESGMSAGHIYNYFESKEQIMSPLRRKEGWENSRTNWPEPSGRLSVRFGYRV